MKLIDIFQQLALGEFAQLRLGETGEITEANWPKVTAQVNLGLTALFKRFNLKQGTMALALQPNQTRYLLHSRYAVSNARSTEPVKYLLDAPDKFVDALLKVESVATPAGIALGLNDAGDEYAVKTPSMTTLDVPVEMVNGSQSLPDCLKTSQLIIGYRANHPTLVLDADPERVDIELPMSHLEALLYFVAARVCPAPISANEVNLSASYTVKYEAECQRLEQQNLAIDRTESYDRLRGNGWV